MSSMLSTIARQIAKSHAILEGRSRSLYVHVCACVCMCVCVCVCVHVHVDVTGRVALQISPRTRKKRIIGGELPLKHFDPFSSSIRQFDEMFL